MKNLLALFLLSISLTTCQEATTVVEQENEQPTVASSSNRIKVLNFATFHMGFTTDANTTEFDENDQENQKRVHEVAKKLAAFAPTVLIVEYVPENNEALQQDYSAYLANPEKSFENPSEVELLAYEVGRLSGTKRIYGIDHKMGYNYNIGNEMDNRIDSLTYQRFFQNPFESAPKLAAFMDSIPLLDKLKLMNQEKFLDFLITINADILTHVGSEQGFEGADEAAKYYARNLRMYSNLNRIPLKEDDRVFILMGGSHTAFFRDFISRSPKYEMVNTFEYLE